MKKASLLSTLLLCACSMIDETHVYVDPVIRQYYDSFLKQAKIHNTEIDQSNVIVITKDLSQYGYCGLTVNEKNTVYIDTSSFCWKIDPEQLVMHELGHYFLHRQHDNSLIGDIFKSIMCSSGYADLQSNRKYYFSELFNPKTKERPITLSQANTKYHQDTTDCCSYYPVMNSKNHQGPQTNEYPPLFQH